jgi:tetratricopeptide (TPR) repeat protein/predicted aspartyl protease
MLELARGNRGVHRCLPGLHRSAWAFGFMICAACAPALAASGKCKLGKIFEFPITMTGMGPITTAKVNGTDVKFMVDSGAFWSIISSASAAELKLSTHPAPFGFYMVGVGAARTDMAVTKVKEFTLAGFSFHNIDFVVGGSQVDAGIGVLGQNLLHAADADVEYDLGQGVVRVMKPIDCDRNVKLAYWIGSTTVYSDLKIEPTTRLNPEAIGHASINGAEIRVMFDSGASLSMVSLQAAARVGIRPDSPGVVPGGPTQGFGKVTIPTFIAHFASFKLGEEEIRNARLRIADIDLGNADMLIGADFFLSHHIYVANGQRTIYFTYNGGPVFNLDGVNNPNVAPGAAVPTPNEATAADAASGTPGAASTPSDSTLQRATAVVEGGGDAGDFSRRGAAMASRRDYSHALIALSRACDLAPGNAEYFYQRGIVYWQTSDSASAMADLNQALKLNPAHLDALLARAELSLQRGDKARMTADLDAADAAASKQADMRYDMAGLYEDADLLSPAIAQFDLWIAVHPEDARLPYAQNSRCWARALGGGDLSLALKDCDAALKRAKKGSSFYAQVADSRGLVFLRLGDYPKSIADYDASIALAPKIAWSWYGRGIDKLRQHQTAAGDADIAQAKSLLPTIAEAFARRGIEP